jgi:hypothetical protein
VGPQEARLWYQCNEWRAAPNANTDATRSIEGGGHVSYFLIYEARVYPYVCIQS